MKHNEESRAVERLMDRPLLLFDGDCGFCRFWVARWRVSVRDRVDFAPAQQEASRFPQITEEAWKRSLQLVTPEGAVYDGAEAVFRTLAYAPERRWMLTVYRYLPGARSVSEGAYRVVANNRAFFSKLTRLAWGRNPQPSSLCSQSLGLPAAARPSLCDRVSLAAGAGSRSHRRTRNSASR